MSKSLLFYIGKRYYNEKTARIGRKKTLLLRKKTGDTLKPINPNSNYFPKINFKIHKIPHAMIPNDDVNYKKLDLKYRYWKSWKNVEQQLDFNTMYNNIKIIVDETINNINTKQNNILSFNNVNDKAKLLDKICKIFNVQIMSIELREINNINDLIIWLLNKERNEMIKKWHRERYMPYNLPKNLIVELPWFYCLSDESSAWKKPFGKKA